MNSFGVFPNRKKTDLGIYPMKQGEKHTLRGLLAEDSLPDRFLVKKYLNESGTFNFDIVEADSVEDTVRHLTNSRFDFLLLDLRLKDGEGNEVLEKLGTDVPFLPTIILTGFDQVDVAISSMRHGVQDYLTKDNLNGEILSRSIWYAIERHKVVEKLSHAKEQVEAADRAKTEFLANMSHEMRTPLSVILASVDLVNCAQAGMTVEATNSIEMIRRNSQHLLSLVDGLLDISRLELGILSTNVRRFDLMQEISPTVESLQLVAQRKGIEFKLLNAIKGSPKVATDPMRLVQILFNVVGNAIKFTEAGSVTVEIIVPPETPRKIKILVSDTGQGVLPEHKTQLFKPFFQGDTSPARWHGGAGLGLALTKRVAKALGGDIHLVESSPGKGATFEVSIADDHEFIEKVVVVAKAESKKEAPKPMTVPRCLEGVNILVVEDCEDNQLIARFFLEGAGAQVKIAGTALEGIAATRDSKYDLILMDIQLPGMDGYGASRELRNGGFAGPIVAVTAHAMEDEKEKCLAAGCNEYISKPFKYDTFLAKLSQLTHPPL